MPLTQRRVSFTFTRTRRAVYLETQWFWFRFYPSSLPKLDIHWKSRKR